MACGAIFSLLEPDRISRPFPEVGKAPSGLRPRPDLPGWNPCIGNPPGIDAGSMGHTGLIPAASDGADHRAIQGQ